MLVTLRRVILTSCNRSKNSFNSFVQVFGTKFWQKTHSTRFNFLRDIYVIFLEGFKLITAGYVFVWCTARWILWKFQKNTSCHFRRLSVCWVMELWWCYASFWIPTMFVLNWCEYGGHTPSRSWDIAFGNNFCGPKRNPVS